MKPQVISQGVVDLTGTRWFDLKDSVTGDIRRIFLWLPPGEAPKVGWPSLWLMDGNAVINTAIDAVRTQAFWPTGTDIAWGALIAIGYPVNDAYDSFRRSWDLGPPPGRTYPPFHEGGPNVKTGGGAETARFILEDLHDFLADEKVALDATNKSLFGHSFGGLFVLWLLFNRPEIFRGWIAASPSITWEDSFLLEHLKHFQPVTGLRVHLSAGEWEGRELAPFQRNGSEVEQRSKEKSRTRTIEAAQEMAAHLAALGLHAWYETYPDETHMSVLPSAVNRAVRWAFALTPEALPRQSSGQALPDKQDGVSDVL